MRSARVIAILLAALFLGGCHLIFRYEDRSPDGAVPPDQKANKDQPMPPDGPTPDAKANPGTPLPGIPMKVPTGTKDLLAIWGDGSGQVFAVGKESTLLRKSGNSWTRISLVGASTGEDFTGVWGNSGSKSLVLHISTTAGKVRTYSTTSGSWGVAHSTTKDLFSIHGQGGKIHAPGEGGALVTNGKGIWELKSMGVTADLHGIWAFRGGEYYLVGDNGTAVIYHKGAIGIWSWVPSYTTATCKLRAVWGSQAGKAYAVGLNSCTRYITTTPSSISFSTFTLNKKADWYGVWGNKKGEIFLVGHDPAKPKAAPLHHFVGSKWRSASASVSGINPMVLRDIWGDDAGKLYAVGHSGVILRN